MSQKSEDEPSASGQEMLLFGIKVVFTVRAANFHRRALKSLNNGDWPRAVTEFNRSLNASKDADEDPDPDVFYGLGFAYENLRELPKAVKALTQCLSAAPGNIYARMALARIAMENSDYDGALKELDAAYDYLKGNRAEYGEREADALASLVLNDHAGALMNMDSASALTNIEKWDEAENLLMQALALQPGLPYAQANLAIIAAKRGDENKLRMHLGRFFEAVESHDSRIITNLILEAVGAKRGDVILDMLWANDRISKVDYIQQKSVRQKWQDELSRRPEPFHIYNSGGPIMTSSGDQFVNLGSAVGAQGRYPINLGGIHQEVPQLELDWHELIVDLERLKSALHSAATDDEHHLAVAEIVKAGEAAAKSDQRALLAHLKAAGQWALDIATKIGTSVAVTALKAALHLPETG